MILAITTGVGPVARRARVRRDSIATFGRSRRLRLPVRGRALDWTRVTDAGLPALAPMMRGLFDLRVAGAAVTGAGLAPFRRAQPGANIEH